jgi:hypothetical protein
MLKGISTGGGNCKKNGSGKYSFSSKKNVFQKTRTGPIFREKNKILEPPPPNKQKKKIPKGSPSPKKKGTLERKKKNPYVANQVEYNSKKARSELPSDKIGI